jgi:hypothetical protein
MAPLRDRLSVFVVLPFLGLHALAADEPPGTSCAVAVAEGEPRGVEWVRAGLDTERLTWGVRGRLMWGLAPPTGQPPDGPRGLIRLRYPTLPGGEYDLINFIAVEPIVRGRKGFSELEPSKLDDRAGKRFWVAAADPMGPDSPHPLAGRLTRTDSGVEQLSVDVLVEPFDNGAHVRLTITQRGDTPDEIELTVHAQADSAPLEYCILTATMGNKARARQLWLHDRIVSSLDVYADYREPDFAPHRIFPLDQLHRTPADDLLVAITTDESDPAAVEPFPRRVHWYYGGFPVTQYWKKPAGTWRDDLHVAVNGRYTYWLSHRPIPGGVSFENFELRERFHAGQRFVFGMTPQTPRELGFTSLPDPE